MKASTKNSGRKDHAHPYLSGNFAPIHQVQPLIPCSYSGSIPGEFIGSEYVRNGGNPVTNEDLGRDAHWFDGDGMLSGVAFRTKGEKGVMRPEFVSQYILTDVYLSTLATPALRTPILPSIATLVNPLSSLITIILRIMRTVLLVALSHLPGSQQAIRKISVANTAIIYHDGRALATCESGPPMRVALPGLETVGWFDGVQNEGESGHEMGPGFGGGGMMNWMKEWSTAHPRVDPNTSELILFHSMFLPPYIRYSIVPSSARKAREGLVGKPHRVLGAPVPGIPSARMMHDFGVSVNHTIIMDLPLSLDPLNLAKNKPAVSYDPKSRSRFGIFPRYQPSAVRWFETKPCCIFHTANSWDSISKDPSSKQQIALSVNMLACRLTSASLVFSAGDLAVPVPVAAIPTENQEAEQCRLYYYEFQMSNFTVTSKNKIAHQWALSAIPFEFPSLRNSKSMSAAKYVYGCSMSGSTFGAALGRAVKINALVKIDVETLIARGRHRPPPQITGCVDERTIEEICTSGIASDPIKVFKMPEGWYAQEPRFIPRDNGEGEDDGWLLSYVFDESQLSVDGECKSSAKSELWIINASNMHDIIARIYLPQRVPYGLHGNWFSRVEVDNQRPVDTIRRLVRTDKTLEPASRSWQTWKKVRSTVEGWIG